MSSFSNTEVAYDPETARIEDGTEIIHVTDRVLAAAMLAVGILLRRDPPYVYVKSQVTGKVTRIYNFFPCTQDGKLTAKECFKFYKQGEPFIKENPDHPFTYALCGAINIVDFMLHELEVDPNPRVAFGFTDEHGKQATILVKENSQKHRDLLTDPSYRPL